MVGQRYQAVLAVIRDGHSVLDVASRWGVSRQTVHAWLRRYEDEGLDGLKDRSRRPMGSPRQMPAPVEAAVLEWRRTHPSWGPRPPAHEAVKRHLLGGDESADRPPGPRRLDGGLGIVGGGREAAVIARHVAHRADAAFVHHEQTVSCTRGCSPSQATIPLWRCAVSSCQLEPGLRAAQLPLIVPTFVWVGAGCDGVLEVSGCWSREC